MRRARIVHIPVAFLVCLLLPALFLPALARGEEKDKAAAGPTTRGAAAPGTGISQEPGGDVTEKEIADIPFEDFAMDRGFVGPLVSNLDHLDEDRRAQLDEWIAK